MAAGDERDCPKPSVFARLKVGPRPSRFQREQVYRVLTAPTYVGRHQYNKRDKTRKSNAVAEMIAVEVPPIVDQASFDAWAKEGLAPEDSLVDLGRKVFNQRGCAACHSVDGSRRVGPSVAGLFRREARLADGTTVLTVTPPEPGTAPLIVPVSVKGAKTIRPLSFPNDIVPVFTRQHCNAGACHAKATGQNGFQLSLLGYEPGNDYDQIVRHSKGRRVSPSAPEASLLLMKASGEIPHEGGARLGKGTEDYRLIQRWILCGPMVRPAA